MPWISRDMKSVEMINALFTCVSVGTSTWIMTSGFDDKVGDLWLPCANEPTACNIRNAEIVASKLRLKFLRCETRECAEELITEMESDWNSYLGVESHYDVDHLRPVIIEAGTGATLMSHHEILDYESYADHSVRVHLLSASDAQEEMRNIVEAASKDGWTMSPMRHGSDSVVTNWATHAVSAGNFIVAIDFSAKASAKTYSEEFHYPIPSTVSAYKHIIGEATVSLLTNFDKTIELINLGKMSHLFYRPFVVDHSQQKIVASEVLAMNGLSIDEVFLTNKTELGNLSFFLGGSDNPRNFTSSNGLLLFSDFADTFSNLGYKSNFAEHGKVMMVKKTVLPQATLDLLLKPEYAELKAMSTETHIPHLLYSITVMYNRITYHVSTMLPLAVPQSLHACDYTTNKSCNKVDSDRMTMRLEMMMDVCHKETDRDFVMDYFTYGYNYTDSDGNTKLLGGESALNGKLIRLFSFDGTDLPIVRHYRGSDLTGTVYKDYESNLVVDSEDTFFDILTIRAPKSHGTYFKSSRFGDNFEQISLAKVIHNIVYSIDSASGLSLPHGDAYIVTTSFADSSADFNTFCSSTYNQICTLQNAETVIGRLFSMLLTRIDESDDELHSAQLLAVYDQNDDLGRTTGLDTQVADEDGIMYVPTVAALIGVNINDVIGALGISEDELDNVFALFLEQGFAGDGLASYTWASNARLSLVGSHMYDYRTDKLLSVYVSYNDDAVPIIPMHTLENTYKRLTVQGIANVGSYLGEAVHYILKGRSMYQLMDLMIDANNDGLIPFLIVWIPIGDEVKPYVFSAETDLVSLRDTTISVGDVNPSVSVEYLLEKGLLSSSDWAKINDQDETHKWISVNWSGLEVVGSFYRTVHPTYGYQMTMALALSDTVGAYDGSCSKDEALPCSEGVMDALMGMAAADISITDDLAIYTIGSNALLRTSGEMPFVIIDGDGRILFNTISTSIAGKTMSEWAEAWDMSDLLVELEAKVLASKAADGLLQRLPIHFRWKMSADSPIEIFDGYQGTVLLSLSQYTLFVFHPLKTIVDLENDTEEEGQTPDVCPAKFKHDCSIEYAEYLEAKTYEALVTRYYATPAIQEIFIDWIKSADGELLTSLIPSKISFEDYVVTIIDPTTESIIGVLHDTNRANAIVETYDCEEPEIFSVGASFEDSFGAGTITQLGSSQSVEGIEASKVANSLYENGFLPKSPERWTTMTSTKYPSLKSVEMSYHSKTFMVGNTPLEIIVTLNPELYNPKCTEGCPNYSECGNDGLFCVCSEGSVLADAVEFICMPKYILQLPTERRRGVYVGFGIAFVVTLMVSVLLYRNRKTKLMRLSSHTITQVVLLGVIILYFAALSFALPVEDYPEVCWARPLLTMAGLSIALLALFLKTWRIQRLVNNIKMRKMNLDNSVLIKLMAMVLVPISIVVVLWIFAFGADKTYYKEDVAPYSNKMYAVCEVSQFPKFFLSGSRVFGFLFYIQERY
eukprot:TRINITY_DN2567_c0_g1_i10.p1 TRINITY_DN2567_c0_g1~~TRINITY_DN2567_c0_g1_i10.p1  ORF type:complete len:1478 (-),score=383.69 TRINITY_DN2567_c0_g1_i10:529-4962(-)